MKHHILAFSLLASACFVVPAHAQEYCLDSASEEAHAACMNLRFKQADEALNTIYQEAMRAIRLHEGTPHETEAQPAAWRAALRDAQRAWIAFKDAECDGVAPHENWTLWDRDDAVMTCRIRLTDARAAELSAHYRVSATGNYVEMIQTEDLDPLERRTLERFGAAVERHDWEEVRSMFDEVGYIDQRDSFGLSDAQILAESMGFEYALPDNESFTTRLNHIAEFAITDAVYNDAQLLTIRGFVLMDDGEALPFTMFWRARMNGGIEAVVPAG